MLPDASTLHIPAAATADDYKVLERLRPHEEPIVLLTELVSILVAGKAQFERLMKLSQEPLSSFSDVCCKMPRIQVAQTKKNRNSRKHRQEAPKADPPAATRRSMRIETRTRDAVVLSEPSKANGAARQLRDTDSRKRKAREDTDTENHHTGGVERITKRRPTKRVRTSRPARD